jgi:hypothetical protein
VLTRAVNQSSLQPFNQVARIVKDEFEPAHGVTLEAAERKRGFQQVFYFVGGFEPVLPP